MIRELYKTIRKYSLHIFIFIIVFTVISLAFSQFGTMQTNDSGSYFYLIRMFRGEAVSFPNLMRPPIYPFFLLLMNVLGKTNFQSFIFFAQIGFLAIGFVFLYALSKSVVKNKIIVCLTLFFCFICYPSIYLINIIGPELLILVGVIIFLYISVYIRKNALYMLLIALLLVILTFTKPIFLYFPIVLCIFYIFLWWKRFLTKKHIIIFGISIILLYILPVMLWSYGNKIHNGYFTFSNIQEINTVGKLLQYRMIDEGPDVVDNFPIKQSVVKYNETDPYNLMGDVEKARAMQSSERYAFELSLYKYGNVVYQNNFREYSIKSFYLIPSVLSNVTTFSLQQPNYQVSIHSNLVFRIIFMLYQYYFITILPSLLCPLLTLSIINGVRYFVMALYKKMSIFSYFYLLLLCFLSYCFITITFGSYESYFRLMGPFYFEAVLLFLMTVYDLVRGAQILSRRYIK